MSWLDTLFRFRGLARVTVADSSTTTDVSDTQAEARVILLGGTLTATRTVSLPAISGAEWTVRNNTAQTINVIARGGTGVAVASGKSASVFCDGTNVYTSGTDGSGADLHSPGPIGDTTPSTIAGTDITTDPTNGTLTTVNIDMLQSVFFDATHPITWAWNTPTPDTSTRQGAVWEVDFQNATPGTSTPGAAAGGLLDLRFGNADRFTSGDADGGGARLYFGTGIGTGNPGSLQLNSPAGSAGKTILSGLVVSGKSWTITDALLTIESIAVTTWSGGPTVTPTWGGSFLPVIDCSLGSDFLLDMSSNHASTIQNVTNVRDGQEFNLTIKASTGGSVTMPTFAGNWRVATPTTITTGHETSARFRYDDNSGLTRQIGAWSPSITS